MKETKQKQTNKQTNKKTSLFTVMKQKIALFFSKLNFQNTAIIDQI